MISLGGSDLCGWLKFFYGSAGLRDKVFYGFLDFISNIRKVGDKLRDD